LRHSVVLGQLGAHPNDAQRELLRARFQVWWLFIHTISAFSLQRLALLSLLPNLLPDLRVVT